MPERIPVFYDKALRAAPFTFSVDGQRSAELVATEGISEAALRRLKIHVTTDPLFELPSTAKATFGGFNPFTSTATLYVRRISNYAARMFQTSEEAAMVLGLCLSQTLSHELDHAVKLDSPQKIARTFAWNAGVLGVTLLAGEALYRVFEATDSDSSQANELLKAISVVVMGIKIAELGYKYNPLERHARDSSKFGTGNEKWRSLVQVGLRR